MGVHTSPLAKARGVLISIGGVEGGGVLIFISNI